jgi:hypothetical protein
VPVSCVPYPRRRAAHTRRRAPASCVSYARIARAYRHHHRLPDRCLKSDCDEELLIHIVFVQKVRLSGIQIKAPGGPGPKSVKLIVNVPSLDVEPQMLSNPSPSRSPSPNQTPSLDFDSAKSTKVTQEVELSQEGVVSNAKVGRTLLTHLLTYSPTHLLTYLPTYLLTYLPTYFPAFLLPYSRRTTYYRAYSPRWSSSCRSYSYLRPYLLTYLLTSYSLPPRWSSSCRSSAPWAR